MFPYQTTVIVSVAAACMAGGIGYLKGREHGLEKYHDYKSAVEAQQAVLAAEAETARRDAERVSVETAAGWAAAVGWHRDHPRIVRVRDGNCSAPEVRPIPTTPGTPDAAAAEPGLGTIELTSEQCEARVNAAIIDASQVMWLQSWILKQHEASK